MSAILPQQIAKYIGLGECTRYISVSRQALAGDAIPIAVKAVDVVAYRSQARKQGSEEKEQPGFQLGHPTTL